MLDFNLLFKKVFAVADSNFDPNENFYTVFVNCAGNVDYYSEFDNQRRMHMGDSYFKEITVGADTDPEEFRTTVRALEHEFAIKVNNAFIFLMDLTEGDFDSAFAKQYLEIVRQHKQQHDTVTVIAVLPEDLKRSCEIMPRLEESIREDEVLYIYNKQLYRERFLSEGICGVTLLHSSKKLYAKFIENKSKQSRLTSDTISGLPAAGAAEIVAKKPLYWSSISCNFSNPKMDYLRAYVAEMCNKARKLNSDDYTKICGELYSGMAEDTNKQATKNFLMSVLANIPKVIKEVPKYDGYTLKDYFSQLYGGDGYKIVELSFKVSLSMMPTALNENIVINVANSLFERASKYHSDDLFTELTDFLAKYQQGIKNQFGRTKSAMTAFVDQHAENDSYEEDLRTYIDHYIKYYELQKCCDFWSSVETHIRNNRQNYVTECEKASKLNEALTKLKRDLQFRKSVAIDSDTVPSCTVADIFDTHNNPAVCADIATIYSPPGHTTNDAYEIEMSNVLKLLSPPGFSSEVRYDMITGSGGYTAYFKQNLGKYLHFIYD